MKAIIIADKDVHSLVEKFRARQAAVILRFSQQDNREAYVADEVCRAIWLDLWQWLQDQGATVVR